jgi:signal transduction histidine kinase
MASPPTAAVRPPRLVETPPALAEPPPPGPARVETASAPPARARTRFATRRRLFLAFLAVVLAFVAAFAVPAAGLARIERGFAELHDHEHEMALTLELESSIRSQFAHQAHLVAGESSHLGGYRDARRRTADLLAQLAGRVDEPEAIRSVAEIRAGAAELDRLFRDELEPGILARDPDVLLAHERTYPLVFRLEEQLDGLFAFLRTETARQTAAADETLRTTTGAAILFAIGATLFAVAVAASLSRSIARPLARLGAGAARMGAGDLSTRVAVRGDDEFAALAGELNAMAAALAQHQERLVRSEKLAVLGRLAAGVAHEINNPLQVMLGYLTLHRDRVPGELGTHLARVEREATRCKEIVEALLQLSRPAESFAPVPVDLREVCEEVAEALRVAAGPRAPAIAVAGEGTALGTRCRFRQIVFNLAHNAADAAGPSGSVRLEVRRGEATVAVAVSDDGPGIPPEARARIFEPFFTTKPTGTGLGLAIARAISNALGGDVEVEAGARGGATFTLRVPCLAEGGR